MRDPDLRATCLVVIVCIVKACPFIVRPSLLLLTGGRARDVPNTSTKKKWPAARLFHEPACGPRPDRDPFGMPESARHAAGGTIPAPVLRT
jgi:hypothetical protein